MARAVISAIHLGELPFHVPMAVFITRDIGSFGSWRGGVLLQSATFSAEFGPTLSVHTEYSPKASADMDQTNTPT